MDGKLTQNKQKSIQEVPHLGSKINGLEMSSILTENGHKMTKKFESTNRFLINLNGSEAFQKGKWKMRSNLT